MPCLKIFNVCEKQDWTITQEISDMQLLIIIDSLCFARKYWEIKSVETLPSEAKVLKSLVQLWYKHRVSLHSQNHLTESCPGLLKITHKISTELMKISLRLSKEWL